MKYVALSQPRQGAFGYVEYSFPGGGNLAANGNSGPIENGIQKTDGSAFNESDDYSYATNYQNYMPNTRVTAYRNGTIIWGQEPTTVQSQTAVAVYSAAKDGTTTSQIQTRLELRNTGNVALPVGALKLRYYFTSDNNQPASVFVDYADMGAAKVAARVVKLPAPVEGADSYVELSFPNNTMSVNALSSLGVIDFRLVRSDYGLFNQSNDYSYAANYGNVGLNAKVAAYLDNRLIFGTPPSGAPARLGASEPGTELAVKVLGNPVVGDQAQLLITGVAGQAVSLRLVDLQGHTIHEQRIQQAGETESLSLPLGQSRGQLLLRVSTESQQQSVKLLRP
ncbi:cellulose binding domain-containing protein [Spirosoma lituiforme]